MAGFAKSQLLATGPVAAGVILSRRWRADRQGCLG